MRILHIHPSMLAGGVEAMICSMAAEMARQGHDVTFLSLSSDHTVHGESHRAVLRLTNGQVECRRLIFYFQHDVEARHFGQRPLAVGGLRQLHGTAQFQPFFVGEGCHL